MLGEVGLVPAGAVSGKYPHELSGGQRQRVGFAQALALKPKLIIADEPVSMLDVSIRIGVLNLMKELREREGVSFLYITHDVAGARYVADRVLVLYAGHLVEEGPIEEVIRGPSIRTRSCCSRPSRIRAPRSASRTRRTSASLPRSSTRRRAAASARAVRSRSRGARPRRRRYASSIPAAS